MGCRVQVASAAGTAQAIAAPYLQQQRSSGSPAQQPAEVPGTTLFLSEPTTGEHNVSRVEVLEPQKHCDSSSPAFWCLLSTNRATPY